MNPKLSDRTASFLDVFRRSAERTRVACGLVAVVSVICIAAFNNLRNENWPEARLKYQAARQERILSAVGDNVNDESSLVSLKDKVTPDVSREIDLLRLDWGIETVGQLKEFVKSFRENVTSGRNVKLPIAGLGFDSNDMGLVFGLSFISFSLFLYKCIRRERRATISAFENAQSQEELPLAYSLMSLEEVLMRPDNLDAESSHVFGGNTSGRSQLRKLIDQIPVQSIVAWMPVLCLLLVTGFDIGSIDKGLAQSGLSTILVTAAEIISLVICGLVALEITNVVIDLRRIWSRAKELAEATDRPTDAGGTFGQELEGTELPQSYAEDLQGVRSGE